jgi:hypothetical protein
MCVQYVQMFRRNLLPLSSEKKRTNPTTCAKHLYLDAHLIVHETNYQIPSGEAYSFLDGPQNPYILWNAKVHYLVHKSLLLVPLLSHINPVHTLLSSILRIHVRHSHKTVCEKATIISITSIRLSDETARLTCTRAKFNIFNTSSSFSIWFISDQITDFMLMFMLLVVTIETDSVLCEVWTEAQGTTEPKNPTFYKTVTANRIL